MEIKPHRRGPKRTGCLVNKRGTWYLRVMVDGKLITKSMETGDRGKAETARADTLAEMGITHREAAEVLRNVVDKLQSAESKARDAEQDIQTERERRKRESQRLALTSTWAAYLSSRSRPDSAESANQQYRYHWNAFIEWLGVRGVHRLAHLTPEIMGAYSEHLGDQHLAPKTQNCHMGTLKLVLKHLPATEEIPSGLFAGVARRKVKGKEKHRQEIPLPKLAEVCSQAKGEMKLLFFLGIYTGMRLKDCALLPWDEIDLQRGLITHTAFKTQSSQDEPLKIPIHSCLLPMLEAVPPAARRGYLLPETAEQYKRRPNTLTSRIQDHLKTCGLAVHFDTKNGQRPAIRFGFHSLRHSAVTLWQQAGAPQSDVMELVGHSSRAMTMRYTHQDLDALRATVNRIPDLSHAALPEPAASVEVLQLEVAAASAKTRDCAKLRTALAVLKG